MKKQIKNLILDKYSHSQHNQEKSEYVFATFPLVLNCGSACQPVITKRQIALWRRSSGHLHGSYLNFEARTACHTLSISQGQYVGWAGGAVGGLRSERTVIRKCSLRGLPLDQEEVAWASDSPGRGRAPRLVRDRAFSPCHRHIPPSMQPARRGDHLMSSLDPNFETAAQQCLLRAGTKVHAGRVGQQNFTLGPSLTHQLRRVPS